MSTHGAEAGGEKGVCRYCGRLAKERNFHLGLMHGGCV